MTSEYELSKGLTGTKGKLEQRLVFVSHGHADRQLALALKALIGTAFSGVVDAFISSDPGPAGGVMPGDQWYAQIEGKLCQAESVWVLATPTSIKRPWIYWEAGIGRALCPNGLVVVKIHLGGSAVPSPLTSFEIYDGLDAGRMAELLGKVGLQIGMSPPAFLLKTATEEWAAVAQSYEAAEEKGEDAPTVSPERLDRLDGAIARLEAIPVPLAPTSPGDDFRQRLTRIVGAGTVLYTSVNDLINAIETAPVDTTFRASYIDDDGDMAIRATRGEETVRLFLGGSTLSSVTDMQGLGQRTRGLLQRIVAIRDAVLSIPAEASD